MNNATNNSNVLLAFNKPKGYLVTRSDDLGRKTVYDLLPDWVFYDGWMPIGRLDLESKGLLLFTRNGQSGKWRLLSSQEEKMLTMAKGDKNNV